MNDITKCQKAIDLHNRADDRVKRLEDELYTARLRRSDLFSRAFDALPDGHMIRLGDHLTLTTPDFDHVAERFPSAVDFS